MLHNSLVIQDYVTPRNGTLLTTAIIIKCTPIYYRQVAETLSVQESAKIPFPAA